MLRPTFAILAAAGSVMPGVNGLLPNSVESTQRSLDEATTQPLGGHRRSLQNGYLSRFLRTRAEQFEEEDALSPQQRARRAATPESAFAPGPMPDEEYDAYDMYDGDYPMPGPMGVPRNMDFGMPLPEEEYESADAPDSYDDADAPDTDEEYEPVTVPPGECVPPSTISGVQNALQFCKQQAPSADTQEEELEGFCDEFFFALDGYMHFETTDERSELRCPENDAQSDGFVVEEARATWQATVRLPNTNIGESDNYTWMQLHGEDTSWIRFAHYGRKNLEGVDEDAINHLWMFIKDGSSSSSELTSISMGPVPDGPFEAGIDLPGDGTVTLSANGFSQTFDISWSDTVNYFKAGIYVQDGNPIDFPVEYSALQYTLDAGQNFLT